MITVARWISLVAALLWGAVAEWHLGGAVGADQYTACLLPLVLDVYGFAAMKSGQTSHVAGALVTMFGAQTAAHLLALGGARWYMTALTIIVSAVPPSVSLACHRLGVRLAKLDAVDAEAVTVDAEAVAPVPPVTTVLDVVDALPSTPHREWKAAAHAAAYSGDTVDASVTASPVIVDAPAETVVAPAVTPVTAPVNTAEMTKEEYAREGARLIGQNYTKTAAAESLGISRQWLHACMKEYATV